MISLLPYSFCFIVLCNLSALYATPSAYQLLQEAKQELGRHELNNAFNSLRSALRIKPHDGSLDLELGNNFLLLGNIFFERAEHEPALKCFHSILEISDNYSAAHHNIAFTLAERIGKHHEALEHYARALQLSPNNAETNFCAALSYLATGNLLKGFALYEYRWQRGVAGQKSPDEQRNQAWDGTASLHGKTFLVRVEQGLGDTLHFIRYAQELKKRGAFVIAHVQKQLVTLLSLCPYLDQVKALTEQAPLFDYQAALLSLPHLLKTTLDTIPHTIPYLYTNEQLATDWQERLASETRFKIGICWHGDAVHGQVKFMPLKNFIPLLNRPDVAVYNLQQYNGLDQLRLLPHDNNLIEFGDDFDKTHGSFMDTAAVMKQLDLVITVDTATAHLAGGLGVPVWIALPFPAEWRWLINRHDSPWYPTATLFRQEKPNEWELVMRDMLATLDVLIPLKKLSRI